MTAERIYVNQSCLEKDEREIKTRKLETSTAILKMEQPKFTKLSNRGFDLIDLLLAWNQNPLAGEEIKLGPRGYIIVKRKKGLNSGSPFAPIIFLPTLL
ncbi:predicted protein [Botrytis cinerea T4]|uniref:Uncharacterized protein n=1 Tax=Botryotinia fuckeliana (strain T4) TaxID=999810 RepID=G2Y4G9_BOTF4|nr:predicted protein [Botrytis cinerea T4]